MTVMSKWKKIGAFLLVLCLIAGLWTPVPIKAEGHTDYTPEELLEDIEGILLLEKSEEHLSAEDNLLDAVFLPGVGNSCLDWVRRRRNGIGWLWPSWQPVEIPRR